MLGGILPKRFSVLTEISRLDLSNNNFSGDIASIGRLPNLKSLGLQGNSFVGTIPPSLGDAFDLKSATFQSNFLSGIMPDSVCSLFPPLGNLETLTSDCGPMIPLIECDCCTECFDGPTQPPSASPTIIDLICNLTQEERYNEIFDELSAVSNPDDLSNPDSPQGEAIDWLVNEDGLQLCPGDETLTQRYVLAVLYYSTDGDNWFRCSNTEEGKLNCDREAFLSPVSECQWGGVRCNDGEKVKKIGLDQNNLNGTVPSELGALTNLMILRMCNNLLTGVLPGSIWNISTLETLQIDNNSLEGQLPPRLDHLSNIANLIISNNLFEGNISSIADLTGLVLLELDNNQFSSTIPEGLGDAFLLETGTFHANFFTGSMPLSVCDNVDPLGSITTLTADCGSVNPLIECICCTQCFNGPVCGVSQETRAVQIFEILRTVSNPNDLENPNTPEGQAFDWIVFDDDLFLCPDNATLTQRYVMAVLYYATDGDNWTICSNTEEGTSNCGIVTGDISSGFNFESRPAYLTAVSECEWFGNSCDENGAMKSIQLDNNNLNGTIPSEISTLNDLRTLQLDQNILRELVPEDIANLTMLEKLRLDNNMLSGPLPSMISQLTMLVELVLNDNALTGDIQEIENLLELQILELQNNMFSGFIPPGLGNALNLGK
uniref:L domain-like protein n=1 Tax=Ditylum brightwellii TaxID=49249 RepID=A0A7S4VGA5_9STRA